MAGNFSQEIESKLLEVLLRGDSYTGGTVYVGLCENALNSTDDLTTVVEPSDSGYSRAATTFSAPSLTAEGKTEVMNDVLVEFGGWVSDAPNPLTYGFVTNAESGDSGEILFWFDLAESEQPLAGELVQIPIDNIVITLD